MHRNCEVACRVLSRIIESNRHEDRITALASNMHLRANGAGTFDAIYRCFSDPNSKIRWWATSSLKYIAEGDPRVVPIYIQSLSNPEFRSISASNLGQLGILARHAGPALLDALYLNSESNTEESSRSIRTNILWAIERLALDPGPLVDGLLRCIADPQMQVEVRCRAAEVFAKSSPSWFVALPKLRDVLEACEEPTVKASLVTAIRNLESRERAMSEVR